MALPSVLSIFFPAQSLLQFDTVNVDCSVEESHAYDATITDYPLENGAMIQDNVWLEPFKLTIKGIITDTQLMGYGSGFGFLQSRSSQVYDALIALRANRDVFQVITGLKIYQNMIFTNLEISRNTDTGYSINISATLKQINYVSAQNNIIPNNTPNNNFPNNNNNGSQQEQPASQADIDAMTQYGQEHNLNIGGIPNGYAEQVVAGGGGQ